ncbi:MAG: IPExxxVDY family protein [Vicingus serpentipes]|nr:IPExxxVDY family protein [Vicingus serpentipes]
MSKTLLTLDDDYDFGLIGISCHAKDYRICWEINKTLKTDLVRGNDYEIKRKNEISTHSFYDFYDETNQTELYLIANKGEKGFLIPEQKTTDFFLLLKGNITNHLIDDLLTKLNGLNLVIAAFNINPENLKSKQNLLF